MLIERNLKEIRLINLDAKKTWHNTTLGANIKTITIKY